MNSLVNEFINFERKIENLLWDSNHVPNIHIHSAERTTNSLLNMFVFYNIYPLFLNMILISEKMTSQAFTDEFVYVLFETK